MMLLTDREKDEFQRVARANLLLAAKNAPSHLIQKVRSAVTVELRDGTKYEVGEEGWI
jgi:hypothetical protein